MDMAVVTGLNNPVIRGGYNLSVIADMAQAMGISLRDYLKVLIKKPSKPTRAKTGNREAARHKRQGLHNAIVNGYLIVQTLPASQRGKTQPISIT